MSGSGILNMWENFHPSCTQVTSYGACATTANELPMACYNVRTHNSSMDRRWIFKLAGWGWSCDPPWPRTARPLTKIKRAKVKVTKSRNISSKNAITQQLMVVSTLNLVEIVVMEAKHTTHFLGSRSPMPEVVIWRWHSAYQMQQEGQHPLTGQRAPPISGGT